MGSLSSEERELKKLLIAKKSREEYEKKLYWIDKKYIISKKCDGYHIFFYFFKLKFRKK